MREEHREKDESKGIFYEGLEAFAREKIRQHLQDLLEQEATEWVGREKSERRGNAKEQPGYRNGYAKRRRFTSSLGPIEIGRPGVRKPDERCAWRVLPLPTRPPKQVPDL